MPYDTESKSRNVLASPLGEEGHEVAKGCTRVRMIMTLDMDVTAERRHYNTHRPLKGKRLTMICASLAFLHPLLSLTHWIFRLLMLPYKSSSHSASTAVTDSLDFQVADAPLQIQFASASTAVTDSLDFQVADAPLQIQFASAKCVRCASLRSGGRRLAVRTAKEHPIGALPRTPFPASRDFPSRGNEKIGGTGYCVTYDTDSQSRNADFILIALRAIPQPSGPKAPSNLRTLGPKAHPS